MAKRIAYLDVCKALAIYLVALGHVVTIYDSRSYGAPLAQFIYSFHTALFMFLSGYFFQSSLKKDFITLLKEKSRQLLLPYLSWSLVALLLIHVKEHGVDNIVMTIRDYILGGVFRYFWYFKLLFLYIVVTFLSIRFLKHIYIGCFATYLFFTIIPGFSFSNIFIPFFLSGFLFKGYIDSRDGWIDILVLSIFVLVLFAFWNPLYNYTSLTMSLVPYAIRTLIGIFFSTLIVLVIKKVVPYVGDNIVSKISYIGTITLGVYASHELFYSKVLWGGLINELPSDNSIIYVIYAFVVVLLSAILVTTIGKNKYFALIFLGKKLK